VSWGAIATGLVLLVLNGFFVAVEISLLAARRGVVEQRAEAGDRRAKVALAALRELPITFSGAQLGITLASLGLGAVAEPAVAAALKEVLGATSLPPSVARGTAIAIALTIVVFLHMVVGEMAPKNLAIARAEQVAIVTARPFALYMLLLRPLVVALNSAASLLARAVGVQVIDERELGNTPEELLLVLGQSRDSGAIEAAEAELLAAALELRGVNAEEAMTPRIDLVAVPTTADLATALVASAESGHTRLPVYDGDIDHVVGVVHAKDLLLARRHDVAGDRTVASLMRPMPAVPGSRDLESLLREMLATRQQIALVVDEFGGTSGIVTLEDVFEELVGDISDEFDDEPTLVPLGARSWLVPGTMRRDDLHDEVGVDLLDEGSESDTVSGWMVDRLGRLLHVGDVVDTPLGWRLEVRTLEGRRAGSIALRSPAGQLGTIGSDPRPGPSQGAGSDAVPDAEDAEGPARLGS
jgi:CBS domain containing-hemolysin-like protein